MTELQRRLLADPYRLEGEGEVPWSPPSVLPDPARVKRVIDELVRGLAPTRPEFLKWICDKLVVLPTQNGNGLNAAIWSDNVIDVCRDYPEDLLQAACLHLLKTKTFRPQPAEIVEVIDGKFQERKRMLERAKRLIPGGIAPDGTPKPFTPEPENVRLKAAVDRWHKIGSTSFLAPILKRSAVNAELRLAELEGRAPEAWAEAA